MPAMPSDGWKSSFVMVHDLSDLSGHTNALTFLSSNTQNGRIKKLGKLQVVTMKDFALDCTCYLLGNIHETW